MRSTLTKFTVGTGVSAVLASLLTLGAAAPAQAETLTAPTLVAPVNMTSGGDQRISLPVFSWTAIDGASNYNLVIRRAADNSIVESVKTPHTTYAPLYTYPAAEYFWSVTALDADDVPGVQSETRTFMREWLNVNGTTKNDIARPTPITGVGGVTIPVNKFKIDWAGVPEAAYYELQLSKNASFPDDPAQTDTCHTPHTTFAPYGSGTYSESSAIGTMCTEKPNFNTLAAGATIYYRVRGINTTVAGATLYSPWSNQSRFVGDPLPSIPSITFGGVEAAGGSVTTPAVQTAPADGGVPASEDSPLFSWTAIAGAESYRVALSRDPNFTNYLVKYYLTENTFLMPSETLLDNNVGQSYYWYVLPCTTEVDSPTPDCATDVSAINQTGKFRTFRKASVPPVPSSPDNGATQVGTILLRWQDKFATSPNGGGVAKYLVEVSKNPSFNTIVEQAATDNVSWSPTQVYPAGTYYWRVKSVNATGEASPGSSVVSPRTFTYLTRPTSPQSFAVTPGARSAALSWVAPSDIGGTPITQYIVRSRVKGTQAWSDYVYDGNVNAVTINGLADASKYEFVVAARNTVGLSPFTSALEVTTPNVPGAPSILTLAAVNGEISATWGSANDNGSPVTGYTVAYRPAGGDWSTTGATENAATISGITGGGTYEVKVAAVNSVGTGPYVTAAPLLVPGKPSAPTNVSAVGAPGSVTVEWSAPTDARGATITGYQVSYRWKDRATWSQTATTVVDATQTSAEIPGLTNGLPVEVIVNAVSDQGVGDASTAVTVTPADVPGAPETLSKKVKKANKVVLKWSKPVTAGSPVTGYRIQYTLDGTKFKTYKKTTKSKKVKVVVKMKKANRYAYRVAAVSPAGLGAYSGLSVLAP